jgi:tryptophan synthase alpha chain
MSRYATTFAELRARREGAFVPFAVLGDPDPATSLDILEAFVAGGADMLELGIPFSDPVADGPTIQAADIRALAAGVTPKDALGIVATFRRRHPAIPIGLLMYANLVLRPGLEAFARQAMSAGVDSILVADLPHEEAAPWREAMAAAGMDAVTLVTPLTRGGRLESMAALPSPYVYVVSRSGVTGRDRSLSDSARPLLRSLKRLRSAPTLLGFGIGSPENVTQALSAGADGAICGSAIVEIVGRHAGASRRPLPRGARAALRSEIEDFVRGMKAATNRSSR